MWPFPATSFLCACRPVADCATSAGDLIDMAQSRPASSAGPRRGRGDSRTEEHTSELQSLMRISYAVFCLKKKKHILKHIATHHTKPNYTTELHVTRQ